MWNINDVSLTSQKLEGVTYGQTDGRTTDKVIPKCRRASQATQKVGDIGFTKTMKCRSWGQKGNKWQKNIKETFVNLFETLCTVRKGQILQNKGRHQHRVTQQIYHHCETESVAGKTPSVGQTSSDSAWHTPNETSQVILGKVIPFLLQCCSKFLDIGRRMLTLA